jgi:hypothetical protein
MWIVSGRLVNVAWIIEVTLKGAFLGAWPFGFGTMAFLYFAVYRNLPPHSAVAAILLTHFTSQNPSW